MRYQTDDEYEGRFHPDALISMAIRTNGELLDISVELTTEERKLLSKYGEIKDHCLYGSIYD